MKIPCPCCAGTQTMHAFSTPPLPVAAALLVCSAEESCNLPRKPLDLWHCNSCGFLWNISFEPELVRYDSDYEGTQIHSPHFARYLSDLAVRWAERFPADTERVLEVGCGQGEFLTALSTQINAKLVGYDPASRNVGSQKNIEMHATLLPEPNAQSQLADIVISRMTLEHVKDPAAFLSLKLGWLSPNGLLAVQVPNATRMMAQSELCELQYEHANYFTSASLVALFERLGLNPIATELDYDGQHLSIFAKPSTFVDVQSANAQIFSADALQRQQQTFGSRWHNRLVTAKQAGQEIWIWGAGSRATAFCANLPDPTVISGAIDINPVRQGSFVPGVSLQTFTPDHLAGQSNLCIVVMNSVYRQEITSLLTNMGSKAAYYYL